MCMKNLYFISLLIMPVSVLLSMEDDSPSPYGSFATLDWEVLKGVGSLSIQKEFQAVLAQDGVSPAKRNREDSMPMFSAKKMRADEESVNETIARMRAKRMQNGGLRNYPDYAGHMRKINYRFAENKDLLHELAQVDSRMYQEVYHKIYDGLGEWDPEPRVKQYLEKKRNKKDAL